MFIACVAQKHGALKERNVFHSRAINILLLTEHKRTQVSNKRTRRLQQGNARLS